MPVADELYLLSEKANDIYSNTLTDWKKHFQWLEDVVSLAKQSRGEIIIPKTPGRRKRLKKPPLDENQPPNSPIIVRKSSRAAAKAAKEKNTKTLAEISNLNSKIRRPSSPGKEIIEIFPSKIYNERIPDSSSKEEEKSERNGVSTFPSEIKDENFNKTSKLEEEGESTKILNGPLNVPSVKDYTEKLVMAPPLLNIPKVNLKIKKENLTSCSEESLKETQPSKGSTTTKRTVDHQELVEELPVRTTRTKKRKMLEEELKKEASLDSDSSKAINEEPIKPSVQSNENGDGVNAITPLSNEKNIKDVGKSESPEIEKRITRSKVRKVMTNNSPLTKSSPVTSGKHYHKDLPLKNKFNSPIHSVSPTFKSLTQEMKGTEVQEISLDSIQVNSSPSKVVKHKWSNNMKNMTSSAQPKMQTPSPLSSSSFKTIFGLKNFGNSGTLQSSFSQKRGPLFSASPKVGSKGLGSIEMNRSKNILTGPSLVTRVQPSKPTKEESEEKKLDELRKKRQKEEEILKKKNEILRQRKEEQKKKNEERMRKVQEAREARERKVAEAREFQEKEKKMREERMNEAKQKKLMEIKKNEEVKLLHKKQAEEEQRRKEKRLQEEQKALEEEKLREEMKRIEQRRMKLEEQRHAEEKKAQEKLELEREREAERIAREKKELEELQRREQERRAAEKDERTLNTTYTKPAADNVEDIQSYRMTPLPQKKHSKDPNDYGIKDLDSEDSTDDETAPKKKIPLWAQGSQLKKQLFEQEHFPPDIASIFQPSVLLRMPDLTKIFPKRRSRFTKRTSSAVWNTTPCKITNLP